MLSNWPVCAKTQCGGLPVNTILSLHDLFIFASFWCDTEGLKSIEYH